MRYLKNIILVTVIFSFQLALAQKKDENIGSEVVNIVKPYSPTISDAFKVKETPTFEDDAEVQKEKIEYSIFSFPVASTFTPAKGKAADVEKAKKEKLFKNYATLGLGNYLTVNAELFITEDISRSEYVGGMIRHLSSQGDIDGVVLDNQFATTSADVTYGSRDKDLHYNVDLGFKNQVSNWYGLPTEFVAFDEAALNSIKEKQSFNTIQLGGKLGMKDSFLDNSTLLFKRFSDALGSGENRFYIKPETSFEVMNTKVKLDVIVDYVGGSFDRSYYAEQSYKYSNINFGASPSILLQEDDYSVQFGASVFYSTQKVDGISDSKVFIYPNIKASYKLVPEILTAYAGAEGTLHQNSYADFVDVNPFVSPTLYVSPTNQKYDVYGGLKGKLSNSVSFNLRASYKDEEAKALFKNNAFDPLVTNTEGYVFGNSFDVAYDNVKTITGFAELKADFSKNVSFGISGSYNNYSVDEEQEAWNLPQIQLASTVDFNITDKWYAGAKVFFVGDRKDQIAVQDDLMIVPATFTTQTVILDSYFDLNAHIGYKYNERLTGFLKGNNLASQNYQRWANFPVQSIQVMIGANYKFDF
ncbi:TonB-dependent receptor [uncultured Flavobacterium sp.]|uniref:TonB-dependent receptor n=1 Tax=uncultured Flavobacterium sp. TaxID=165435 RepID=UPI0030EC8FFA|tara:strand:- start:19309 stop:21063 length:1755 start_codon:yes stop_codon:yes gene_type:complete